MNNKIKNTLENAIAEFVSSFIDNSYSVVMFNAIIISSSNNLYTIKYRGITYNNIQTLNNQVFSVNDVVKVLANRTNKVFTDIIIIGK